MSKSLCSYTAFLDITLYKGARFERTGVLDVKPFFKKTNKFQYLEYSSSHPRRTFSSLVKGEMTRLLRACSDMECYANIQQKMSRIFRDRGYPKHLLERATESVPFTDRRRLLEKSAEKDTKYDTFLVTEYTPDLDVKQLSNILKPDQSEEGQVPTPCLSLRKTKNLSKWLVRAKLKDQTTPTPSSDNITIPVTPIMRGISAGCATPGCKCCRVMSRKVRGISTVNHRSFEIPDHTNCNFSCVVYLLECTKCTKGNQYVGQTGRKLSERLAGHRAARTKKPNLPLYKHFNTKKDHDFERDTKLTILEKTAKHLLLTRESHWMNTLETVYPKGLNSRFEDHKAAPSRQQTNPPTTDQTAATTAAGSASEASA